jgi:hypothetical protein
MIKRQFSQMRIAGEIVLGGILAQCAFSSSCSITGVEQNVATMNLPGTAGDGFGHG